MRHLSQCTRLPLTQCTEAEFEEDLYAFLTHRGEVELANDLRNKRINWCARPRAPPSALSAARHAQPSGRPDLALLAV